MERKLILLGEKCPNFDRLFKMPSEWIFTRAINGNSIRIEDFYSKFDKKFKTDPNYEPENCEEYFLSINRIFNNFNVIIEKYINVKLYAPKYKKSIAIFQIFENPGYIYLIENTKDLHYNFFCNNLMDLSNVYINQIYNE